MAKWLKVKFRKFWGISPTMFVEVTGEKLVRRPFLNRVNNNEFKNEINEID